MTSLVLTRARTVGKNIHYYFLSRNLRKMPYRREGRPLTRFQTRGRVVEHIQLSFPIKLRLTIPRTRPRPFRPRCSGKATGSKYRGCQLNSNWNETDNLPESKLLFFEDLGCSSVECKIIADVEDTDLKDDNPVPKCECPERSVTDITDELTYVQMKGYFNWITSFFQRWKKIPRRPRNCRRIKGGNSSRPLTSVDDKYL